MRGSLLIGLALLTGCGSDEQSQTIAGTTYSSNDKEGTATISSNDRTISVVDGKSAASTKMPVYAPQYPGSTIESAIANATAGSKTTIVTLATSDAPGAVSQFYTKRFAEAGLSIQSNMTTENGALISAEGDGKKVSLVISREAAKTTAVISTSSS